MILCVPTTPNRISCPKSQSCAPTKTTDLEGRARAAAARAAPYDANTSPFAGIEWHCGGWRVGFPPSAGLELNCDPSLNYSTLGAAEAALFAACTRRGLHPSWLWRLSTPSPSVQQPQLQLQPRQHPAAPSPAAAIEALTIKALQELAPLLHAATSVVEQGDAADDSALSSPLNRDSFVLLERLFPLVTALNEAIRDGTT